MLIVRPVIIAPDSAHWSRWIDAALRPTHRDHESAVTLYDRLIAAGRIPLLTFHHLEELLAIDDGDWAMRRIAFIQSLPLVGFVRCPDNGVQTGTIVDMLAAEVAAALAGADSMAEVRKAARGRLVRTGTGTDVIGTEMWVWRVVREECLRRNRSSRSIAAVRRMGLFDDRRTVGEIVKGSIRQPSERRSRLARMSDEVTDHVRTRGDVRIEDPAGVANWFMSELGDVDLPPGIDVRGLLEWALTEQGLDREEIRDDAILADLNRLAIYRTRLKIIADYLEVPYVQLKEIDPGILPSLSIHQGLERYGQDRQRRPGSDLTDECLAALAPYVDELFVDRRTREDFRRLRQADKSLFDRIGMVRSAAQLDELLG